MTENHTPASPAVLADGEAGAVFGRVDGMHQARYIEMFLAGFDAKTGAWSPRATTRCSARGASRRHGTPPRRRSSKASTTTS